MDIILIPGLWLGASSWDRVLPGLEAAGHRPRPLTLPGLESPDADRSGLGLLDHVEAAVAEVDACSAGAAVVGHSAGAGLAWAAADARPDRVAHLVLVGGFPTPDGRPLAEGFATDGADLPLPDWSEFDDADLRDLDPSTREEFRRSAVPSPARLTTDPQRLRDERRYDVPITVVCPEFSADDLRSWIEAGEAPVAELSRARRVRYVNLPTGHWPQFSRPDELARVILAAVEPSGSTAR